jgi:hypothetical protein
MLLHSVGQCLTQNFVQILHARWQRGSLAYICLLGGLVLIVESSISHNRWRRSTLLCTSCQANERISQNDLLRSCFSEQQELIAYEKYISQGKAQF